MIPYFLFTFSICQAFLLKSCANSAGHVREANHDITQAQLSIEIERNAIHRHLLLCLALVAGEKGSVPDLVVVQTNSREITSVFPGGELPAEPLEPNMIYGVLAAMRHGAYSFLDCAMLILLANSPNKELMRFIRPNLKNLRGGD
jgi:hypothetical protein